MVSCGGSQPSGTMAENLHGRVNWSEIGVDGRRAGMTAGLPDGQTRDKEC